jgi:outer membrane protein TolC
MSILFLSFFSLSGNLIAQEKLTLDQAIALGLENNYEVKLSELDLSKAKEINTIGEAGFLPTLDANGSYSESVQDANLKFTDGSSINRANAKSTNLNAALSANWEIFDGTKMFITKNTLEELERSADLSLKVAVENTLSGILLTYYQLSLEEKRLEVYEEIAAISAERVKLAENKNKIGSISGIELTKAQVDYNGDQSALIQQQQTINELKTQLNIYLGRSAEIDFNTTDTAALNTTLVYEDLKTKLFNNSSLNLVDLNIKVAQYESKSVFADRLPSVKLNAAYNYTESTSEAGFVQANQNQGITYGVSASIPIFNGFDLKRKSQLSKITIDQRKIEYDQLKNSLLGQFLNAYQLYTNNIKQIDFENKSKNLAKSNLNISLKNYDIGGISSFDLRDIQIAYANAENRYIEAVFNAKSAEIELLRITNQLIEVK